MLHEWLPDGGYVRVPDHCEERPGEVAGGGSKLRGVGEEKVEEKSGSLSVALDDEYSCRCRLEAGGAPVPRFKRRGAEVPHHAHHVRPVGRGPVGLLLFLFFLFFYFCFVFSNIE
jgi:hypothetical protein